jgi:uncharacterized membrane protein
MDPGTYYQSVIITVVMALTFIALLLIFIYLVYGAEEKKEKS